MTDRSAETVRPVAGKGDDIERAARRRLARRYAAEKRFRFYGIAAIAVSIGFLGFLVVSVVVQSLGAFTHYHLVVPVTLPSPGAEINHDGVVRDGVRELFPHVTERRPKRELIGLISSGAGSVLRDLVEDKPGLAGGPATVAVPLADAADLYLKGEITGRIETPGRGELVLSGDVDQVTAVSSSEDFRAVLDEVKAVIAAEASAVRRESRRLGRLDGDLQAVVARRAELDRRALALQARIDAGDGPEPLGADRPSVLLRAHGGVVRIEQLGPDRVTGQVLAPLSGFAPVAAGEWSVVRFPVPESSRKLSDRQIVWLDALAAEGRLERQFNTRFFTAGASREPELAGILGAVVGTALTMLVTLLLSFPAGVAAAIYLEEFAPRNRFTDFIEININNLAAVPSIVFGLLGLAVFLNVFGLPRSAPLVGGMVLALMTLPTIVIASRAALRAVPPSIRDGALAIGASPVQAVFQHIVPLALPGIMTGSIIGMAQALGETAPLLMIGMVAFVVDIPGGLFDPATALPVQIFMWADFPEPGFRHKSAAAILVLLAVLVTMNLLAVLVRRRFERRW